MTLSADSFRFIYPHPQDQDLHISAAFSKIHAELSVAHQLYPVFFQTTGLLLRGEDHESASRQYQVSCKLYQN
jgi:hypothetical protein